MAKNDEGIFKKPLSGSFKRVANRMEEEMETKSPTDALRDDLSGSSEPTEEEQASLDRRVDEERNLDQRRQEDHAKGSQH